VSRQDSKTLSPCTSHGGDDHGGRDCASAPWSPEAGEGFLCLGTPSPAKGTTSVAVTTRSESPISDHARDGDDPGLGLPGVAQTPVAIAPNRGDGGAGPTRHRRLVAVLVHLATKKRGPLGVILASGSGIQARRIDEITTTELVLIVADGQRSTMSLDAVVRVIDSGGLTVWPSELS
jgi:hypothetical protein